jgi:hypothetical protein
MEFVDQVLTGPDEYFICRQKHCKLVSHSDFWVHNHPDGQYLCPACSEKYQPWKDLPGNVAANKVFVCESEDQHQSTTDGLPDQAHAMIFPIRWPEMDNRMMISRCRRICLDIDKRLLSLPPKDRLGFVLEHLSLTAPFQPWDQRHFRPNTKDIIDHLNTQRGSHQPVPWQYHHIVSAGYRAINLGKNFNLDDPMEFDCFVRTFGLSLWLLERAAASRRCA